MSSSWERLLEVMAALRGGNGCPWDREQTPMSLTPYIVEEAYEVIEAIESNDPVSLKEELGDLLLQIVFQAQIASEAGLFDSEGVAEGIVDKMIRRHPHVFGEVKVSSSAEVVRNWEAIKLCEKNGSSSQPASLLDGIPMTLPALLKAERVQGRAAEVGFDWPEVSGALEKVPEEIAEIRDALKSGDKNLIREEFGDLLFALVNVGRHLGINSEEALRFSVKKFDERFRSLEEIGRNLQKPLSEMSLEEMDEWWNKIKKNGSQQPAISRQPSCEQRDPGNQF